MNYTQTLEPMQTPVFAMAQQALRTHLAMRKLSGCFRGSENFSSREWPPIGLFFEGHHMKTLIAVALVALSSLAFAHSGGTDKWGCHTDKETGWRHCH